MLQGLLSEGFLHLRFWGLIIGILRILLPITTCKHADLITKIVITYVIRMTQGFSQRLKKELQKSDALTDYLHSWLAQTNNFQNMTTSILA